MKRLFPILVVIIIILQGCFFINPIEIVLPDVAYAGRFVHVGLKKASGEVTISVRMGDEEVYHAELEDPEGFEFFARLPGTYTIEVNGKEASLEVRKPRWLFLVWMAADNDLSSFSYPDLSEMISAEGDVSVVVMRDLGDAEVLALSGNEFSIVERYANVDSGSGSALKSFLEKYGAYDVKKVLVLWNHGTAWIGDSVYLKAVAADETSDNALATLELKDALSDMHFEILGFDACLMGSVEVIYELRDVADYIVASGDYEVGYGWDYVFLSDVPDDSFSLAKEIVDTYISKAGEDFSLTVFDTSKVQDFVNAMKGYVGSVSPQDVQTLAENLKVKDENRFKEYLKDATDVTAIYEPAHHALDDMIVYSRGSGYVANILFPNPGVDFSSIEDDYQTLSFETATGWFEYLKGAIQ